MLKIILDLDLPPAQRFDQLVKNYNVKLIGIKLNKIYDEFESKHNFKDLCPRDVVNIFKFRIPYLKELAFWSNTLNIHLHKLLILQLWMELNTQSTTIVTPIQSQSTMIQTLDSDNDLIHSITYYAVYYKNSEAIYEGITWLGFIGLFTGKSFISNCSIGLNNRYLNNIHVRYLVKIYIQELHKFYPVSVLARYVLESLDSYDDILLHLKKCKVVSPVYFVFNSLSNPNTNCIIQRSATANLVISSPTLIQTNHDVLNWFSPNYFNSIERLVFCINLIKSGKHENIENFFVNPVFNPNTIYINVNNADTFDII